ncbi:hypothetical protein GGR54DRAFT_581129 [Hypoxylon sp. NC1633]|nr:hypothetical protein GGR54DRAFT_581129 [Hypoxylon sp. NC1633]
MASTQPFIPAWDPEAEPGACRVSSEQVGHMEDFMAGNTGADECAMLLTKPVREAASQDAETMDDAVFAINSFINSSASTNPDYQPQMLLLIKAIQKLPLVEVPTPKLDEDGGPISLGDENERVWEDMPGFGHLWGDKLRARQADFYDNYNSTDTTKAATVSAEWANAIAWSARLVSLHDPRIAGDFFLYFTSYSISHVLEVKDHPMFARELPAAAMGFRHAAPELLRLCRQRRQTDAKYALYGTDKASETEARGLESLWTGLGGYSLERWDFWKSRWQALGTASALEETNRTLARDAVGAMESAERLFLDIQ